MFEMYNCSVDSRWLDQETILILGGTSQVTQFYPKDRYIDYISMGANVSASNILLLEYSDQFKY